MLRYLNLFKAILSVSMNNFIAYRLDAVVNSIFVSGIWAMLNVLSMYAIASKGTVIFGWTVGELLLLSCMYNVFIGMFGFLFSRGFNEFSYIIDTGRFDLFLLKPIDSQFYLSFHTLGINYLVRSLIGIVMAIIVIVIYHIPVQPLGVVLFLIASFVGILLLYAMLFGLNIFVMWAPKLDNINELFYSLRSLGRYPRETFRQLGEVGFVLLSPFVILLATPVKMLIGKGTVYDFVELSLAAVFMFVVTRLFWQFALRHYVSASS